jgi:hypothetical protein
VGLPVGWTSARQNRRESSPAADGDSRSSGPTQGLAARRTRRLSAKLGDGTNVWEFSLSAGTWHVSGTPRRLTTGTGPDLLSGRRPAVAYLHLLRRAAGSTGKSLRRLSRVERPSPDGRRILYAPTPPDGSTPTPIALLDLVLGEKIRLIEHPTHRLFSPRFLSGRSLGVVSRVHGPSVPPHLRGAASRKRASSDARVGAYHGRDGFGPRCLWDVDGNLLYFFSERDGFTCIWAQRVEPATKRPVGDMFPVYHPHHARRSLRSLENLGAARLSTAPGKLVFSIGEYTGNIWVATPQER